MCASSLFLWGHRSQSLCSMFMYEGLGNSSLDYCILPRANPTAIKPDQCLTAAAPTGGESFHFSQDIHHHSSTYVLSFSVTLDPNESMPAPSRRNVFFSGTMLTLVCPFMYIYAWASIHTTSIFKTSTEVLSIVLDTPSRNTQSCRVCRLKGKTLLLPYL